MLGTVLLGGLRRDLTYALRMLRKRPAVTAAAVLSLALGIGANTAIFGLIDALLLRRLPVPHPEHLFQLVRVAERDTSESFPYPVFSQVRANPSECGEAAGFALRTVNVKDGEQAEKVTLQLSSGSYFHVLGVEPARGRAWAESRAGAAPEHVLVISDAYWRRRFDRSPSALGSTLFINEMPFTVAGIMPEGFAGTSLDYSVDLWAQIELQPELENTPLLEDSANWVRVITRLKPGLAAGQVGSAADLIHDQYRRAVGTLNRPERVQAMPADRPEYRSRKSVANPLLFAMGVVGLVLMIACANVANLQLARAAARRREMSIRLALGARRGHLVRQLLAESVVLSLVGGALGLVLAFWGGALLNTLIKDLPPSISLKPDASVLAFTAALSIAVGLLFGLSPALQATRGNLLSGLKENPSDARSSHHLPGRRQALLVSQFAVSFILLVIAGLLVRSFQKIETVDLGFQPDNVVQIQFAWGRSYDEAQVRASLDRIAEQVRAAPGVASAAICRPALFAHSEVTTRSFEVEGEPPQKDLAVHIKAASPEFFSAMRIALVEGRAFDERDTENSARVGIIGESAARAFFRSQDPIGKRVRLSDNDPPLEIVGLAKDVKLDSVLDDPPRLIYVPLSQDRNTDMRALETRTLVVRTDLDPGKMSETLRQAVKSGDPGVGIRQRPLIESIGESLTVQKAGAWVTGIFGLLGLALAAIGAYGLQSYLVGQRTREIGIRMALGATRAGVLWLIWRQAMLPVMIAILLGLGGAVACTRLMSSHLFGLPATDPLTMCLAMSVMLAVAGLASLLPAYRASRVEPMEALRYE